MLVSIATTLLIASCVLGVQAGSHAEKPPTVKILNGTYQGVYSNSYDQDFFLGMPYAQPPLGSLRFRNPQPLNTTWQGVRNASAYSDICYGYGSDSIWYPNSEDCLTINVVRPAGTNESSALPVAFWLHGGGLRMGAGSDQRYNMSFMIQNAVKIGKPFIGVSINYRLGPYGFLYNNDILASGQTNAGFRDQRLALHWVQENIAAFGGDRTKVTIWGQSSGAASVAWHMAAYDGRDDGLFRAGIQESGSLITGAVSGTVPGAAQTAYKSLLNATNCTGAIDRLDCLRQLPAVELNSVLNGTNSSLYSSGYGMVVDGDIVRNVGSVSLRDGTFVKVPILYGSNTDEGTGQGPTGINTTEQFYTYLTRAHRYHAETQGIPPQAANELLKLYPDNSTEEVAQYLGNASTPAQGLMWRRTSTYAGDYQQHSGRRFTCQAWAQYKAPAYCYRFNVHNTDVAWITGAAHFEEVSFVFYNLNGVGYHYGAPFNGTPPSYAALSRTMTSMWASFIADLDPNTAGANQQYWPPYDLSNPVDFLFDANVTSHGEPDTWRAEGIAYLNSIALTFPR
ncbi:Carboxylic ester hydrolase [Pleurostoma richardsiae]|uniref:Carboxylic ester hydrolase n=1 Tax=Pleurostoma richardsiae TaxID=41990 RepID=A0AA38VHJ8_9PEZI|nr:Carboxylic ester hydrolase [Pleurostoma richardsiae]